MAKRGKKLVATAVALAMVVGGLVGTLASSAGAAPPNVEPTITPPDSQTAVKRGDEVGLEGSITPGSEVDFAFLRFRMPNGELARDDLILTSRVTATDGAIQVTGTKETVTIPFLSDKANDGDVTFHVRARDPNTGEASTGVSDPVPIDLANPVFSGIFLTAPRTLTAHFSEPVENPAIFEEGDWVVDDSLIPPSAVETPDGQKDQRVVDLSVLAEDKDEDATAGVDYRVNPVVGHAYHDRAGNALGLPRLNITARDAIPPVVPTITHVAGEESLDVLSNDLTPEVRLTGLRTTDEGAPRDHHGRVYLETGKEEGFQPKGPNADALIGEADNDGSGTAVVDTEAVLGEDGLGSDGTYTLYGVAADRALCNPPDGIEECPNVSDAAVATYRLDTVAPAPRSAVLTDGSAQEIVLEFTENIVPDGGNAAEWTVTSDGAPIGVTGITGGGDQRNLTLATPVPPAATTTARWMAGDYGDAAGNAMKAFEIEVLDMVPPGLDVLVPLGKIWTQASSQVIRGSTSRAEFADVYSDLGNDGTPDGDPISAQPDADGIFAVTVGLQEDGKYDLLARARKTGPEVEGPIADIPTITRDTVAPQIAVLAPTADQALAGGSLAMVRWSASDPSFGPGAIRIEFRKDPGSPWNVLAPTEHWETGEYQWEVPKVNAEAARVRITATDRAGNAATDVSAPFVIDSIAPEFGAITLDRQRVQVDFSEPVTGVTNEQEWRIDGVVVEQVDKGGEGIKKLVLQTFPDFAFGKNHQPLVTYKPAVDEPELLGQNFRDRAGNPVPLDDWEGQFELDVPLPRATVKAQDGIAPKLPELQSTPSYVNRRTLAIKGTAEAGGNEAVVRRRSPKNATYRRTVDQHEGSFAVPVGLVQNRLNYFDLVIEDPSGNTSKVKRLVIREDSYRPRVTVLGPRGRVRAGRKVWIRWRTGERFKSHVRIYYRILGRGKYHTIISKTKDDGRVSWRIPGHLRGRRFIILVQAFDRAKNRGGDFGWWLRGR